MISTSKILYNRQRKTIREAFQCPVVDEYGASEMKSDDERVRVLHVITRLDKGGSADVVILTVLGLDRARYRVSLAAGRGRGIASEIEERFREEGLPLIVIPQLVRNISPLKDLRALWRLYRLMVSGRFQIIHTHTSKAGILGRWAARLAGVPIIVHTPHGHVFYGYYGKIVSRTFMFIEKVSASFTDAIITLTRRGKEEHISFGIAGEEKFRVIPSGVNIDHYRYGGKDRAVKLRELGLPLAAPVILSTGRLEPVKGHRYLIMAASEVVKEFPDVHFLLAGDGALTGELKSLAHALGVGEKVRFLGMRDDVAELLSACDLFVLPSVNEGMGLAIVEAMAAGKAVVTTRVGGVPDLVEDGQNGILVEPEDPAQLAAAIIKLLKDKSLRTAVGENGRAKSEAYSVHEMIRKIDELYRELINRGSLPKSRGWRGKRSGDLAGRGHR